MTVEIVRDMLMWSLLINWGVLLLWFFMIAFAHDWVYRLHTRWFKLSRESFDKLHYGLMGAFKLLIFIFNLAPYIALRIVI
ncbi:hypothetical protein MNBD_DELTA01-874 [hydrothermal vent metagenome]|uniref:DUF6868 domain-containing protein n=1 Tax=hydrothermal vent metagenome TaxID=652676 RepID=A0A3B0RCS8_9ZZZZ